MTAAADAQLIFNWGPPRRRLRAISAFVAGSLLLHAFCFYLFQIVYPPAVAILPPPARVSLISNRSEEGRALLRWIDAEDPALASATQRPPDANVRALPKLQHIPSYMSARTPLKQPPPLTVDLRPPSPQPPGPVPTTIAQPAPKPLIAPTVVAFSEEIAALGAAKFPAMKFSASGNDQPENVRIRVAINGRGEVAYSFPINSSGDPALDEQARQYIALTRFPARSQADALSWGVATVQWGNDLARPAAANSTARPSP